MTNTELLDIRHKIESKIKKQRDRCTHKMIYLAIIAIIICMILIITPLSGPNGPAMEIILKILAGILFVGSIHFGVNGLLGDHKLDKHLDYLEKLRRKGEIKTLDTEMFIESILPDLSE